MTGRLGKDMCTAKESWTRPNAVSSDAFGQSLISYAVPDPVIVQSLIPVVDARMIMCQLNEWSSVGLTIVAHVISLDVVVNTLHGFFSRFPSDSLC